MKIDSKGIDPPALHRANGKDRSAGQDSVSRLWYPSEHSKHKSTDSRCIDVGNLETESVVQLADVRAARNERLARPRLNRLLRVLGGVVLVENLADNLLEKIFHRDDAGSPAVLIENDSHVLLQTLEVGKHVLDFA